MTLFDAASEAQRMKDRMAAQAEGDRLAAARLETEDFIVAAQDYLKYILRHAEVYIPPALQDEAWRLVNQTVPVNQWTLPAEEYE
jgi:hypothetical protein